jgi:hypothetical protein
MKDAMRAKDQVGVALWYCTGFYTSLEGFFNFEVVKQV